MVIGSVQRLLDSGILINLKLVFIKQVSSGRRPTVLVHDAYGALIVDVYSLLNGHTPTIKTAVNKTEYIINKFVATHGQVYDYTNVIYVGAHNKVVIGCKTHGDFLQSPHNHRNGAGCPKCGTTRASMLISSSTDNFIHKAQSIHGTMYDYSEVKYTKSKVRIKINCNVHGSFWQTPDKHLAGSGCPKCGKHLTTEEGINNIKKFVTNAHIVHNNKYTYENTMYSAAQGKVCITCMEHGDFYQSTSSHLQGHGCPKCARALTGWRYTTWRTAGIKSKHFSGFKVYVVECCSADEKFYKIGKTFVDVTERFNGGNNKRMPYTLKVIAVIVGDAEYISKRENKLLTKHNKAGLSYVPTRTFKGMYECFTDILWEDLW